MEYPSREIIENGNTLIAKFMGYEYYPHPNHNAGWRKEKGHIKLSGYYLARTTKLLRYHQSWSWLIRVIEKISITSELYITLPDFKPSKNEVYTSWLKQRETLSYETFEGVNAIISTWLAVIKAIEILNKRTEYGQIN